MINDQILTDEQFKGDRVHVVLDLLKKQKALNKYRMLTKALLTCPAVKISEFNLHWV